MKKKNNIKWICKRIYKLNKIVEETTAYLLQDTCDEEGACAFLEYGVYPELNALRAKLDAYYIDTDCPAAYYDDNFDAAYHSTDC